MKEIKIIGYFPRSHFWKIWEKRKVDVVLTETDEKVTSKSFYRDGTLKRDYVHWNNGDQLEKKYFPNGQLSEEMNVKGNVVCRTYWDINGRMLDAIKLDERTKVETHYYPDGTPKIRYSRNTGEYEEWTHNGILKKKGYCLYQYSEHMAGLKDTFLEFETGNMRIKRKDEQRQGYNKAIDAINCLPASLGRKIAKQALAKEYKKALCERD